MRRTRDDFYCGVMAALAIVFDAGEETLAEEIVRSVGTLNLLRVAKREDDPWLKNLRATARELKRRESTND